MAKERDMNPNYPILNMTNHEDGHFERTIIYLPSCFVLGEKLRDVTVLR
jgi:hypothetical protein